MKQVKHYGKYIVLLIPIIGMVFLYQYFSQRSTDAPDTQTEISPSPTSIQPSIELISEVEGYEPVQSKAGKEFLIDMLDEIHFWDGVASNDYSSEPQAVIPVNSLLITLTSDVHEHEPMVKSQEDETVILGNKFVVEDNHANLLIYVNTAEVTPEILREYMLKTLFSKSQWARITYDYYSTDHIEGQKKFADNVDFMVYWFSDNI